MAFVGGWLVPTFLFDTNTKCLHECSVCCLVSAFSVGYVTSAPAAGEQRTMASVERGSPSLPALEVLRCRCASITDEDDDGEGEGMRDAILVLLDGLCVPLLGDPPVPPEVIAPLRDAMALLSAASADTRRTAALHAIMLASARFSAPVAPEVVAMLPALCLGISPDPDADAPLRFSRDQFMWDQRLFVRCAVNLVMDTARRIDCDVSMFAIGDIGVQCVDSCVEVAQAFPCSHRDDVDREAAAGAGAAAMEATTAARRMPIGVLKHSVSAMFRITAFLIELLHRHRATRDLVGAPPSARATDGDKDGDKDKDEGARAITDECKDEGDERSAAVAALTRAARSVSLPDDLLLWALLMEGVQQESAACARFCTNVAPAFRRVAALATLVGSRRHSADQLARGEERLIEVAVALERGNTDAISELRVLDGRRMWV